MDVDSTATTGRTLTPEAAAFAAQLRAERAAAGMSQDDLSKATGIGQRTILRIENGQRVMDTSQLSKICTALGITIATFAMRAEERLEQERESERAKRGGRRSARRA